eukprot:scaffold30172_cov62-Phaeocystis_antarctica.AAC.1
MARVRVRRRLRGEGLAPTCEGRPYRSRGPCSRARRGPAPPGSRAASPPCPPSACPAPGRAPPRRARPRACRSTPWTRVRVKGESEGEGG